MALNVPITYNPFVGTRLHQGGGTRHSSSRTMCIMHYLSEVSNQPYSIFN